MSGLSNPYGTVHLGGYIYVACQGNGTPANTGIYQFNLDLTGKTTLINSIGPQIGLTTDGTYLYSGAGSSIYRVTQAGTSILWASTSVYYLAADTVNNFIYVSTGSSITRIVNNFGTAGTITTNWSTGYSGAAEMYVNNTDGFLYVSCDNGVFTVPLASGGAPTSLGLSIISPASGNQAITILGDYMYVGSNNAQNISIYSYPGFTLLSNNWKTGLGNLSNLFEFNNQIYATNYGGTITLYERYGICLLKGTKILCEDGYRLIEDLKPGDLVKTSLNGFKAIDEIKHNNIYNTLDNKRTNEKLYVLEKENYPELHEDLVITGGHSILVDHLTDLQRELTNQELGGIFVTENKYRLLASIDERTKLYPYQGNFEIYHICLENEHSQGNYGIYANGLLVESCCKRHIV